MDRNPGALCHINAILQSLSARRAWIEMEVRCLPPLLLRVALRKESVDRNCVARVRYDYAPGRSPQGERG